MNGSERENVIFISEQALLRFSEAAADIASACGAWVQLARITGKRWEYVSGAAFEVIPSFPPERIILSDHVGIVLYPSRPLSQENKKKIVTLVREAVGVPARE